MSRTTRDYVLEAQSPDDVKGHIFRWFHKNGFKVLTKNSTGAYLEFGIKFGRIRLKTHKGTIVAVHGDRRGTYVFELYVFDQNGSTVVRGQFYMPGGGYLIGKEWDFDLSKLFVQYGRHVGFFYMKDLENYLKSTDKIQYISDLEYLVKNGSGLAFLYISNARIILSIFGIVLVTIGFVLLVSPYIQEGWLFQFIVLGILVMAPLILVPCISNLIMFFIFNKRISNDLLFNRIFSLGLIYVIGAIGLNLYYAAKYGASDDAMAPYYVIMGSLMLLLYGFLYMYLAFKLFPRTEGIIRLWTDPEYVPLRGYFFV